MMMKKTKERKVYKDLIRDAIYDAIANGELKPGDRIIEMEWAEYFSSSQAPVREAIRELESLGVVESLPFKGASVRILTDEELRDIQSIRAGLESIALRNAIRKAEDADIMEVRRILDEMVHAAEEGDREIFLEKDIEFHEMIIMLSKTTDLLKLWNMCNVRIWTALSTDRTKNGLIILAKRHEPIYEALKSRDEDKVFEIMTEHFEALL